MRVRKVNRYYCDFCKKANCSRPSIERHERGCTLNPNRHCGMCEMLDAVQQPIAELITLLPDSSPIHTPPDGNDPYKDLADAIKEAMPKLREATHGCPACIMAALRQAKIPVPMAEDFDFTKESASILADWREEQNAEFRRVVGPVY